METPVPKIENPEARERFRNIARAMALDPDNLWVGGYVEYEWRHSRHTFEGLEEPVAGRRVLEFGCNYGATSVVLGMMGARVTAVDVDAGCVQLAQVNAERYGVADRVEFLHVPDTMRLPFPDRHFEMITCNSVLEYVPHGILEQVQRELDRVLKPKGLILVLGTSNRLWPKEIHSNRWFVNYLPRAIDALLASSPMQRGIFPWEARFGFGDYDNLDWTDRCRAYLEARARMGMPAVKRLTLQAASLVCACFGVTVGLLTPTISVALRKR